MQKSFLTPVEICFICFWIYFFSINSNYYLSDPDFWFRIKNTIYSFLSYVLTRGPKSNAELEHDSQFRYEMITIYDLLWVICLWIVRFNLPTDFSSQFYTLVITFVESV